MKIKPTTLVENIVRFNIPFHEQKNYEIDFVAYNREDREAYKGAINIKETVNVAIKDWDTMV